MYKKVSILILRVTTGWLMFYAGITKILDPEWTAAGYLSNAKTFPEFYAWFARPEVIDTVNLLNEWGLTILGASLMLGLWVRWSAPVGAVLMMLYYFPVLTFPTIGDHYYIVDDHIIDAAALLILGALDAGRYWGIDGRRRK